jgi:Ca-activated chloride channel homolog
MKTLLIMLMVFAPLLSCHQKRIETPTITESSATSDPSELKRMRVEEKTLLEKTDEKQKIVDLRTFQPANIIPPQRISGSQAGFAGTVYRQSSESYSPRHLFIEHNTEDYQYIRENIFNETLKIPLSTFSIDVDGASYANARRFINSNQLPPKDAVRIEEFINYFPYNYDAPKNSDPVSIHSEVADCPWAPQHQLVRIGLKGKNIQKEELPASNLVFLIDVSGSMHSPNKLTLLKKAFRLLVNQLRKEDTVSIVVYAGQAGLVLPATSGDQKGEILEALERLEAGGSTAGGQGIKLAYETAKNNFLKKGNNRIILATDGDFNVGASSEGELVEMIEEKREAGIFLTILGFGMGNYKDSKMEILSNKGNGNYAYIDNLLEAQKVLVNEIGATLHTIAKDVKIQVEFNPSKVQAYRLMGYENRLLRDEDFNNDKIDAGEMGAGSTVTALYEIIPVGVKTAVGNIDPLKYQTTSIANSADTSNELLTIKFRYKEPSGTTSKLVSLITKDRKTSMTKASDDFRFAAAVAGFGMLLRNSPFKNDLTYDHVLELAGKSLGSDPEGYRAEFLRLVKTAQILSTTKTSLR